ncbi:hypothetical protein FRB93_000910 [Tulasnella sp. JGI-2019a]|nr:hypothetical protein FRB93_000910 [Tulasnella sp. JGI-2019a]
MHEALKIPELVLRILNFANSAGDVYSIALVCRFFADLALEVLWTDWPVSVEGLLALLPDDLLYFRPSSDTKRSMISFQRSLVPRDWERIIDIGPSVKNLTYTERPEQLDSQVPRQYHPGYNLTSGYPKMATSQNVFYQLAFHRQSSHILPNLERLRWSAAPRLIILFLCPTLRALEMASSEYETGIFPEVEMRLSAANLKTLKLEVEEPSSHLDPTLEELSRLFEWAEELTDVTLSRDYKAGYCSILLPREDWPGQVKLRESNPPYRKQKANGLLGEHRWLPQVDGRHSRSLMNGLASITITFSGNLVKDLKDILVAISERCPGLQYLNIRPDNEHYNFIEADTRMQDVYQKPHRVQRISRSLITVDFFKPILMLKELEELVLEWPYAAQPPSSSFQSDRGCISPVLNTSLSVQRN